MSRIVAGVAGGLRLAGVAGDNTRPTTDRVKEALFSRLESYGVVEGARVLDVFGGSGALACEALSRGAAYADVLDVYPKAVATCEKNLAAVLKAVPDAGGRVHKMTARSFVAHYFSEPFDLVFCDPPYAMTNEELSEILELLTPHLAAGAVVVLERSTRSDDPLPPSGLEVFASKKYGETTLWYVEPAA
ncbi:16S rRNA (guanine(966)-N(2))-methyltransferase RsmD [Rothia sp. ZJ1223]|uniref:16S rRNA (guanine(966)-N(2))-methyltransferase RsmD n=1 Tax=Rothia sp. ZJ1223 TaxID=2811098 RepID=UPI0019592BDA|nr:16S rRNA (guanine(966)-N(2))-methyltransferase RsmD [Rothia sp. ZJ1223]MBM7050931.1 16S rRNA (guanine(966)-N(2))-methyltransferase RsmD [Rothia sp. ZJ1223]